MHRRNKMRVVVVVWGGSESLKKTKVRRKGNKNRDGIFKVSSCY